MNPKNIGIFGYVVGISTIISQVAAFLPNPFQDPMTFNRMRNLLAIIWLDIFQSNLLHIRINNNGQSAHILILLGGILMLIGAIQYSNSNGSETRLIRCMLGVVFLNGITGFVESVFFSSNIMYRIISGIEWPVFCGLAFAALKTIGSTTQLETAGSNAEGKAAFIEASRGQRAIHWIVDTTLIIFILSSFVPFFYMMDKLEEVVGNRMTLFIFFFLARLIYYPLFETLFNATPGKFLTRTRVLRDTDATPDFINILGRTLSRYIPFDPVSFFSPRGWHDSVSHTKVVKEAVVVERGEVYDNVIDQM